MNTVDSESLIARFWNELQEVRTGMLGLVGARESHSQPMTAHFDGKSGPLWFYTLNDSELLAATAESPRAVFHYAGPGHKLYACVHGEMTPSREQTVINHFWSDEVARWFPDGRSDGSIALLRFEPERAQIWLPAEYSSGSLFKIGTSREQPTDPHGKVVL